MTSTGSFSQPSNSILVPRFEGPGARSLILSGGKYAIGGTFAAWVPDTGSPQAPWPLELTQADGSRLGAGHKFKRNEFKATKGKGSHAEADAARAHDADEQLRGKCVVVVHPAGQVQTLVGYARAAGAAALLVVDPNRTEPRPLPSDLGFPVVSVGAATKYVLSNENVPRRYASMKTDITTASLVTREDSELLRVAARLLLCWLVPDVRWVLRPVS